MKISNALSCFSVVFLFLSCSIVGLNSGYNHLTENQKKRVVDFDGNFEKLQNDGMVYRITTQQLSDLIKQEEDVAVYEFTPFCRSNYCIPPALFENFCKKKGYRYVIVSVVYDNIIGAYKLEQPLFMIDTKPYGTNIRSKYQRRFFNDLTGTTDKERDYNIFHYFHKGKYVNSYKEYIEIP